MIDAKKVQMMTKLAMFEKKEEQQALQIVEYSRWNYVSMELLKTFVCVTVGYVLLVGLLIFGKMDYYLEHIFTKEFEHFLHKAVVWYIVVIVFYFLVGGIAYYVRYRRAKKKVIVYDRLLSQLRSYNRKHKK
ncbi:MAG: hypothetical protein II838_02410 [Lachnospiraceae bacterium]|nr:hypothetical protein [Lachnospiraceae bacterium]